MSVNTIAHAKNVIRSAERHSPVAVFKTGDQDHVESVFAGTVETHKRIVAQDRKLIGIYSGADGVFWFVKDLIDAGILKKQFDYS